MYIILEVKVKKKKRVPFQVVHKWKEDYRVEEQSQEILFANLMLLANHLMTFSK